MTINNQNGFSLAEILLVAAIMALMLTGGAFALSTGRATWFTTEAKIQVQENLRRALDNMHAELRQTRPANIAINDGGGTSGSDIIDFSVPVICHTGDSLLDASGDVAHWGATLNMGCRLADCMDADNDCSTIDFKLIRYEMIAGNQLVRRVLNNANSVVKEDILANNISDFQITTVGSPVLGAHIDLTASSVTDMNRNLTVTVGSDIIFRNK